MSEIRANTISDAAGTGAATLTGQFAAKAWVNFNGTSTVSIRDSGNVSSITDNGTGDYNVNFSNSFPDSNYATQATAGQSRFHYAIGNYAGGGITSRTRIAINEVFGDQVQDDDSEVQVAIFR